MRHGATPTFTTWGPSRNFGCLRYAPKLCRPSPILSKTISPRPRQKSQNGTGDPLNIRKEAFPFPVRWRMRVDRKGENSRVGARYRPSPPCIIFLGVPTPNVRVVHGWLYCIISLRICCTTVVQRNEQTLRQTHPLIPLPSQPHDHYPELG